MAAAKFDLEIEQGATYLRSGILDDDAGVAVDITGWIFRAQIRATYLSTDVLATAVCTITNGAAGEFNFEFSATATAAIPYHEGRDYVWDLEAEKPDGTVLRILQGKVVLSPEATRA